MNENADEENKSYENSSKPNFNRSYESKTIRSKAWMITYKDNVVKYGY